MYGAVSHEVEVNVPASQAWEVYGTLLLGQLFQKGLTQKGVKTGFQKAEVLEGDGGVGTILRYFFAPGNACGFASFKERYVTIDDEKRVKEKEVIGGGYLDLGFSLYRLRFEVIEKSEDWCITRSIAQYEAKEADDDQVAATIAASTKLLLMVMEAANNHLINNNNNNNNNTTTD